MAEPLTVTIERGPSGQGARLPALKVEVRSGPDTGLRWAPKTDRFTIGTHDSADLCLPRDRTVSRFHCELALEDGRVAVRDCGSRNGTRIDGVAVVHAWLQPGQRLEIGESVLELVVGGSRAEAAAMPLSASDRFGDLVGGSTAMRAAFAVLERAALSDATVLIDGETGTGKEGAAEALHRHGARRDGPFVVVDCGAVAINLMESELFGHERGAFTGALADRVGAFEAAHGGTLFLDEIGELGLELQPKLLRALERREVKRVGGTEYKPVDVRVVAATHRSLKNEVNAGTFRADLYFRLAVIPVRLPALRERREDLPALVEALLAGLGVEGEAAAELRAPAAQAAMRSHPWPGNVRELRNYLERCITMREVTPLEARDGPLPLASQGGPPTGPLKEARVLATLKFERLYLDELLAAVGGNVSRAAREAGVDRKYLHRLLRRHGLR